MVRNLQYTAGKRAVEEGIRFYGGNLEYAIPATLYLMSPLTRNFTIRQIGSLVAETWKFKKNMLFKTGKNLLKGGKPIGYTSSSGTGYLGRGTQHAKNMLKGVSSVAARHPVATVVTVTMLLGAGYVSASETSASGFGSPHASGMGLSPSQSSGLFDMTFADFFG